MGRLKQIREQEDAQGYRFVDQERTACAKCLDGDEVVATFIAEAECGAACWYCGQNGEESRPAAPVNDILDFLFEGLASEYGQADAEGMPVTHGSYLLEVHTGIELLTQMAGLDITDEMLWDDIHEATEPYVWCEREPLGPRPHERVLWSWRRFAELVKHRVRYVVNEFREGDPPYGTDWDAPIAPHEMLGRLGAWVGTLPTLLRVLPAGTEVWRARVGGDPIGYQGASALGPPPPERAVRPNRMSAPGISLFYGAFEPETAVAEASPAAGTESLWATLARFELARDITVLDLDNVPALPSIFEHGRGGERWAIHFLATFSTEVSRPVDSIETGGYEYAPTQFLTEYFRHIYRTPGEGRVEGIAYPSARVDPGSNIAIFVGPEGCSDPVDRTVATLVLKSSVVHQLPTRNI